VESTHGKVGCVICHGGDSQAADKEAAHLGLVADPSGITCDSCHQDIACLNDESLHTTLSGMEYALEVRGGSLEEGSVLATAFENHCGECHTSCGQCHVSRPDTAGGGLVAGHEFRETPSTKYNCVACHGSRVGAEYLGENPGIPADVHWTKATMLCTDCHDEDLHGSGNLEDTRYENPASASCDDCHQDVWTDDNPQHQQHLSDLSCQVCHSVSYSNCYDCHVAIDEQGLPYRTSEPTEMQFKIGLNPERSSDSPYQYVVVRHVPVSVDSFSYYGENLLPEFDVQSTWKFATPHNIQLHTPQNESCDACHGNSELFLTGEDVRTEEIEANRNVIVNEIPEP